MLGLYKASNRGRHSILVSGQKSAIEVPITTLDDLTRKSGTESKWWSLVKMDVEGYEGFVLEGAQRTLSRTEILVAEFSPTLLKLAGVDPAAIFDKLSTNFSRVSRIEGPDLVRVTARECLSSEKQVELVFER